MNKRTIARLIKYGLSGLFVLISAAVYVLARVTNGADLFPLKEWFLALRIGAQAATDLQWYHWICDGLTLPSMLLLSAGIILWVSNAGALDVLGYAGRFVIQMFLPAGKKRYITYGDYVLEKQEKRIKGYGFLLIAGAISLAVNFVFLALHQMSIAECVECLT